MTANTNSGALLTYSLGVWLGRDRVRALIIRVPLMKASDFDHTERWFAAHGTKAVFFGRMVPLFRSMVSLPAGVARMSVWQFLALTTLGSLIWNSVFVVAGYLLGANWLVVEDLPDGRHRRRGRRDRVVRRRAGAGQGAVAQFRSGSPATRRTAAPSLTRFSTRPG